MELEPNKTPVPRARARARARARSCRLAPSSSTARRPDQVVDAGQEGDSGCGNNSVYVAFKDMVLFRGRSRMTTIPHFVLNPGHRVWKRPLVSLMTADGRQLVMINQTLRNPKSTPVQQQVSLWSMILATASNHLTAPGA